jgi:hypothetical protein
MTRDRAIGLSAKGAITAFTFAFLVWYVTVKWMALRPDAAASAPATYAARWQLFSPPHRRFHRHGPGDALEPGVVRLTPTVGRVGEEAGTFREQGQGFGEPPGQVSVAR